VHDFRSIVVRRVAFDSVETYTCEDATDLIDCSFSKPHRLRVCAFVLHFGIDPFFEWVVVHSTSPTGLPPNQKLLFIINRSTLFTGQFVERNRGLSSAFRLIADGFCDIPTQLVFHIPTDVSFMSNAALLRLAKLIRALTSPHFRRSQTSPAATF
jgi:hypothetical protein